MLFDGVSALGKSPDLSILETVESIESVLGEDRHEVVRVPVNPDGRWIERIRRGKFDLAFNMCEGVDGVGNFESPVIGALELLSLPYTGSSSWTTALCLRKHVLNTFLGANGVPVPAWALARAGSPPPSIGFPVICKPAAEDASIGIEQKSVARTPAELESRLAAMHERWDEIVVQRFIDGREVNVGIVGDTVLPIAEIDFSGMPDGLWRIVSYRSKWESGCEEDLGAVPICPAPLTNALRTKIEKIALSAWRAVGGSGYGRVDMRIDGDGRPWVLEVNANPDFSPTAGLARMARVAGLSYGDLVRRVCEHAIDRPRTNDAERWHVSVRLSGVQVTLPLEETPAPPTLEASRRARVAGGSTTRRRRADG
jgi:D-alanine-D-alanine ligase